IGIMSDGVPVGTLAPSWALPDLEGIIHRTPATNHWQVLLSLTNRSLHFRRWSRPFETPTL
ncbi:MAG TPA: hypothetical protein VFN02_04095, partial [Ktedonobacteraceae bacterium]|nr:hypothetical protein [Ktedonobacteraceae bacterium]